MLRGTAAPLLVTVPFLLLAALKIKLMIITLCVPFVRFIRSFLGVSSPTTPGRCDMPWERSKAIFGIAGASTAPMKAKIHIYERMGE